jgi:tetratricopeptide (TPR) repeat protein
MKTNRSVYSILAFSVAIAAVAGPAQAQGGVAYRLPTLSLTAPQQTADDLYNAGVDLQGAGKFEEAIKKYDEAIKKRAVFPDAWLNRGICYLAVSKWDPAIENFNLYIGRKPEIALGYINRATAYAGKKMFPEALKDYETAITKKPTADQMGALYLNRGNAYFNTGDFDKAIADYSQAITAAGAKADPVIYLNRGNAYMNKGAKALEKKDEPGAKAAYTSAATDFTAYIKAQPTDAEGYLARAEANVNAKNFAPVVDDVTKYYSMNGTDAAGYAFRAQAYLGMTPAKVAEASADIEKAIAKDPSNPAYSGLFLQLAKARLDAKDYKGAVDVTSKLLAIPSQSKNMGALRLRAFAYVKTAEANPTDTAASANAIKDYDLIIAANPKEKEAIQNRAASYYRLKQYDKAALDADLWAQADPTSVEPYNLKGLCALSVSPKKYPEAIAAYTKVIEKKPNDAAARYNRGMAYYDTKQWDKAITDLEEAAKDSTLPQAKEIPGMIATAYANVPGGIDKAIEKLKQQVAAKPTDGEAHYNLAALLFQKANALPEGDAKKAAFGATLPHYTKAIELLKNDPDPLQGRALAYFRLGQWDNAIKDAGEVLRLNAKPADPKNADALFIRADSIYNKKDKAQYTQARADYTAIVALPGLKPEQYDDARDGIANIDALTGNFTGAIASNTELLKSNPKNTAALRGRGAAYYNNKQYDLAIKDFDEYLKLKADDASVYYLRGLAYKMKGDGASALKDYEKSFGLKADFAVGNAAGELYLAEGDKLYKADTSDPDKAFDMYDKAAAIFEKAAVAGAADKSLAPAKVADAYFNKGLALTKKGDMCEFKTQATPAAPIYKEAIAAYEKYLAQTPPPTDAPKVKAQIELLKEKAG